MADSSLADTKLAAVSEAISDLLDAYPDATSDQPSPSLTRAVSSLREHGIQVDAAAEGLCFRFDECDSFASAASRIADVTRSVANESSLTARYFLSSTRLLLEHPVDLQLPEGDWEVEDSRAVFVPSFSLRYNYRHEGTGTSESDANISFGMQIVRPLPWVLSEDSNWRTGVRSNLHIELHGHDWVDVRGHIAEILGMRAAMKAHTAASAE